jgi:ABC-type antimicrobial peptide transport system permease subunit
VVVYQANRRTHEIGLRMALGASALDVLALVTGQGMRPVLAGLVVGLGGAFVATRLLRSALFGVTATDPATFAVVGALLAGTAAIAAVLPARRASRLDPGRVLTRC